MINIKNIILNDFKNFMTFRIFHFMLILSIFMAVTMGFFPQINALNFVYISVFIIPVIIFSISMYLEHTEKKLLPCIIGKCNVFHILLAKVVSALTLNLIPLVLYILVMTFVLNMHFSIILFILVFLVGAITHIVIGVTLAIISKSSFIMSMSYIGYIVIFSFVPIFYANNLIPTFLQYVMIISPAYLSGILFENIIYGYLFSPDWLIILAVFLPILYVFILSIGVVKPYFETYLLSVKPLE